MRHEKDNVKPEMRYSAAYPTDAPEKLCFGGKVAKGDGEAARKGPRAERCLNYRRIHFAVMAIESAAKRLGVPGQVMHDRLKAQNLIHNRLLARYDDLHTQSLDWVAEDIVTTLKNWED